MKKTNILSLTFCIFGIFLGSSALASSLDSLAPAHVTPAITFKNLDTQQLAPVTGYPQGKPAIIFYSQAPLYGSSIDHFDFPKLYKTDTEHLAVAATVNINQFEDLSKTSNISKDFLISELPLPNNSVQEDSMWRALYFKKVIWFDKTQSFYALGILESHTFINTQPAYKTKKIIILESTDGIHWTVNRDGSDTLPVSSDKKVEIAGSGPVNNPVLIMSIDKKIYAKHLKSSNAAWELSSLPSPLPNSTTARRMHFQDIYTYKDKFLFVREIIQFPNAIPAKTTESSLPNTDEQQLKIAQEFFLSDDGKNWKQLTFDSSDVIGEIYPDGNGELIHANAFGLLMSAQKDAEGLYTITGESPTTDASRFIGKIVIDETNNKISLDKKFPIRSDSVTGICSLIHIPNSTITSGKYYMNFYTPRDIFTKGVIMATESLEDSSKIHLASIDYGKELFDPSPDNKLINFNNEPYLVASLITSNTPLNIDTIFYHIDSIG